MTKTPNLQPSDDDLELLSAYIDDQLAAGERGALDERLGHEPELRGALDELRGTVTLLRELEPLPLPRSFTLDPAVFAPRPSPLFGWLRLGATMASVLLALTFAIDFVGSSRIGGGSVAAPASAPEMASGGAAQRSAFSATESAAESAPAAAEQAPAAPAAAAPTVAPAAAAEPAAAEPAAAEPTAAPAAAALAAPSATPAASPNITKAAPPNAPAGAGAAPATPAPAAGDTTQSADASNSAAADSAPPTATALPTVPIAESGSQSPNTTQLEQPAGGVPGANEAPSAQPRIGALRIIEISLAALAVLLGLGAVWVRRRGR